jgi:hypothetical protein
VSGRSQDARQADASASRISVSREFPLTLENPFAARPSAPRNSAEPDDAADNESLDDKHDEELSEADLAAVGPIFRLPPVAPIANELAALGEITSLPEMELGPTTAATAPDEGRRVADAATTAAPFAAETRPVPEPKQVTPYLPYVPQLADAYLYTPSSAELTGQLLPAVQRGCNLAQRGALFAAKAEFIQVIRRVAQANDAEWGTDQHSRALAEGLRALDEAADFVPDGTGLEGELDVQIAASSHRTPIVRQGRADVAPHTAVALYHSLAQERLAAAVGGQQSGSMALYGLGKIHARLAERNHDDILSTRSAMTMYAAALAACPSNHLAANELGVLLCRNGHPGEAARLFERSIDHSPRATTYHNLAVAQQRMGMTGPAIANRQEADRLAAWERSTGAVSRRAGVEWVSPSEMAHVASPPLPAVPVAENAIPPGLPTAQNAPSPIPNTAPPVVPKSPWQKATEIAKRLPLPGAGSEKAQRAAPSPRVLTPGSPHNTPMMTPWR